MRIPIGPLLNFEDGLIPMIASDFSARCSSISPIDFMIQCHLISNLSILKKHPFSEHFTGILLIIMLHTIGYGGRGVNRYRGDDRLHRVDTGRCGRLNDNYQDRGGVAVERGKHELRH